MGLSSPVVVGIRFNVVVVGFACGWKSVVGSGVDGHCVSISSYCGHRTRIVVVEPTQPLGGVAVTPRPDVGRVVGVVY
jgi:hypothetical protein